MCPINRSHTQTEIGSKAIQSRHVFNFRFTYRIVYIRAEIGPHMPLLSCIFYSLDSAFIRLEWCVCVYVFVD